MATGIVSIAAQLLGIPYVPITLVFVTLAAYAVLWALTLARFAPSDLMPPYWINMGAMAISTLAGTLLLAKAAASPLLTSLRPFLLGLTILFWATATWWIPMLVILGVWRHVWKRFPLTYSPL